MSSRRAGAAIIAAGVALGGVAFVGVNVAEAHTPNISRDCAGITVAGTSYESTATASLTVNGATQTATAGGDGAFSLHADFTPGISNTYVYSIDAANNDYDRSGSGLQQGCATATTTTTSPTTSTTTPTTTTSTTPPPSTTTTSVVPNTNAQTTTTTTTIVGRKVFVCKYTGTPGVNEVLQGGNNPISVDYQPGREPGQYFNDGQGRSYVIAYDTGQDEPDPSECPPANGGTTTTTSTTSTTIPRVSLFAAGAIAFCGDDNLPVISITFGNRPDLNGQTGVLSFSTGGSVFLVFQSNQTVTIAYPDTTLNVNLIYSLGPETATASVTYPENCPPTTTTTTTAVTTSTTTIPGTTTTAPSTTTTVPAGTSTTTTTIPSSSSTTTTSPSPGTTSTTSTTSTSSTTVVPTTSSSTTLPETFTFGAAATVCVNEVPTIRIVFRNQFPELTGTVGTLTMYDVDGNLVSTQPLTYLPGATVDILYPGTTVNSDGSIADVPGWILQDNGLWVRDPSDEFLREGIHLVYELNPTAEADVTYPPESSACADPDNPPAPPGVLPPTR